MQLIVGIDIGGTKSAISFARYNKDKVCILEKKVIPTPANDFNLAVSNYIDIIGSTIDKNIDWNLCSIGISCGGPLDSESGVIMAPPNLPEWKDADIFTPLKAKFNVPVAIQNDADACALAEWKLGAGKGAKNMIFMTFGTGMGAGLIINSTLYTGSSNFAGEIGHVRLTDDGPIGYGKQGSFEGYCSGGGIANLGKAQARKAIASGNPPSFCKTMEDIDSITAKKIASALEDGDPLAKSIYDTVGRYLGRGISIMIDLLNPEIIVIGSIFVRQQRVLEDIMWDEINKEALIPSANRCKIVPASLGEMIGDYAAISVGINAYAEINAQVFPSEMHIIHNV